MRFCAMSFAFLLFLPLIGLAQTLSETEMDSVALGDAAFEEMNYEAAVAAYEQVGIEALAPEALNRFGIAYHVLDRLDEAEQAYEIVADRDETLAASHNNLGAILYARREFGDAEDSFEDALERDPENSLIQDNYRAVKHARRNGRRIGALIESEYADNPLLIADHTGDLIRIVVLMPPELLEELRVMELRGDSLMARKLYAEAIEEYSRAIEVDRDNARLINKLGIAYHQNQEIRDAERQCRAAVRANEYFLPALNNLGSIEQARERYIQAHDYFVRALLINPRSATVLQNLGYCLFAMERYEDGLLAFIEAIRIDPALFDSSGGGFGTMVRQPQKNEEMVSFYLAKMFANLGEGDRAISMLYRALEQGFTREDLLEDPVFDFIDQDERFIQLRELVEQS